MPKRDYCHGVYYYVDKTTGKIDYIGLERDMLNNNLITWS